MYIVRSGHRVNSYVHNAVFQDLKIYQTLWRWSHQRGWTMSKISIECIKLKCWTSQALIQIQWNLCLSELLHGMGSFVPTIWYSVLVPSSGDKMSKRKAQKNKDWCTQWGQSSKVCELRE
jgi:hypothetical protein